MKTISTNLILLMFYTFLFPQTDEWTNYNTNNTPQKGPCNNYVFNITQDDDSNYWFTTDNGVSKFDGVNWQSFFNDSENGQDNTYSSIAISSENNVYLSLWYYFGGFATISNNQIEIIDYIPVFDLDIDSNNNVWLATPEGLKKYDGTEYIDISSQHEMLTDFTGAVEVDRKNHIWAGTYNGVLFFNDTLWQNFTTDDGLLDNFVFYIESDYENNIWMMNGLGFSKYDGNSFTNFPLPDSLNEEIVNGMTIGQNNTIYVSTENYGLLRLKDSSFSFFNMYDGLKSNEVFSCFEDIKQNLWIGYYGYGVDKYNGEEFTNYSGNGMNTIDVLKYYHDKLYIGSLNGGLTIFDGTNWENHNISNGFLSNLVSEIDMDSKGNIWMSTLNGIVSYNGSEFTNYNENNGLPVNNTLSVFVDNDDHIWIGTFNSGAAMYNGQNWTYYNAENSLLGEDVRAIAQINNTMWFGSSHNTGLFDGTIQSFDGLNWNSYQPIEGIVRDIVDDSKGNIWFGYVSSNSDYTVAKYNFNTDEWETFKLGIPQAITSYNIYDIYEDKDSLLWFGRGLNGVTTYDGENWVNYTSDDGYPQTTTRAITQDADGNMWFGSYLKGLYKHTASTTVIEQKKYVNKNDFLIYPNPSENFINVQSNKEFKTLKNAKLYNIKGILILEKDFRFDATLNIKDLNSGIYILKITNKFYDYSEKIIKK